MLTLRALLHQHILKETIKGIYVIIYKTAHTHIYYYSFVYTYIPIHIYLYLKKKKKRTHLHIYSGFHLHRTHPAVLVPSLSQTTVWRIINICYSFKCWLLSIMQILWWLGLCLDRFNFLFLPNPSPPTLIFFASSSSGIGSSSSHSLSEKGEIRQIWHCTKQAGRGREGGEVNGRREGRRNSASTIYFHLFFLLFIQDFSFSFSQGEWEWD